jgi:integrase
MAQATRRRKRQRGYIEELKSGALRVKVYAGVDSISKRAIYLSETVPAGPKAAKEAEAARTRLLNQVDEKRNPRTRATVDQLIDKWLSVLDVDPSTRRGYEVKIRKHIRPVIGSAPLTRLDVETLDSFYAELRRCRDHCNGRPQVEHRTRATHLCDEHTGTPCTPPDQAGCRNCRRACKPHVCKGLADSTVRQVHWILSGALDRAVIWKWISVNPAAHADKPALPHPDPRPPTAAEAARLVEAASASSPDWGAFVWTKMTTGTRRGEMCGLRWNHVHLDASLISIRRTIYVDESGKTHEKDTKTHQQRRVVLDPETVAVLRDHRERAQQRATKFGPELSADAYVFSPAPDGSLPLLPDTATQRYKRMADRLRIHTTLKNLRHYSATELISAGVDVRTVAGRLGHGGGGATTLRVYTAWSAEADQRAAATVSGRMPARPATSRSETPGDRAETRPYLADQGDQLYHRIAADLRGAILSGVLMPGDPLPSEKALAARYGVAASTAHRAVSVLVAAGQVTASRGMRAVVAEPGQSGGGVRLASITELRP